MAVRDRHDSTHSSRLCGQCKQRREVIAQLGVATGNNCARASLPSLDDRRDGRRHSQRAARAGPQADSSPPPLLLARDVRAAGDQRAGRGDLVAGRDGARSTRCRGRCGGSGSAATRPAAHRRARLRPPARLVAATAGMSSTRRTAATRWSSGCSISASGAHGRPLVANGAVNVDPRWSPDGTRLAFVSTRTKAAGTSSSRRRATGRSARRVARHRGRDSGLPRYYYSALGPLPLAHVVAGRHGADPRLQPRAHLGLGRLLAHGGRARRAHARDPLRGDDLEGAARLGAATGGASSTAAITAGSGTSSGS